MEYRIMFFVKSFKLPMKLVAKAIQVGLSEQDFYDELTIKQK